MAQERITLINTTADGHTFQVICRKRFSLALSCNYFLRITHKNNRRQIIMEKPMQSEQLAIQMGDQWTLEDYILSLK